MWRLNLPLVSKGYELNRAQIYFLLITDPRTKTKKLVEHPEADERGVFNELATGMPLDVAKEQLKKIGIDYDNARRRKSSRFNSRSISRGR